MNPRCKIWKQILQQAAGYYTLRFAGLFNLPIPLRFAFGIGVSQTKTGRFLSLPVLEKVYAFNLFDISADDRGNLHHINGLSFFQFCEINNLTARGFNFSVVNYLD